MKIYIHDNVNASAISDVSKAVDKFFEGLSRILDKIASWGADDELAGKKQILDVVARNSDDTTANYKLLWMITDAKDSEFVSKFQLKTPQSPSNESVEEYNVVFPLFDESAGISDKEYEEEINSILNKVTFKLIKKLTGEEPATIDIAEPKK